VASQVTVGRQAKQGARQRFHNDLACTPRSYELARGPAGRQLPQLFTHLASWLSYLFGVVIVAGSVNLISGLFR